MDEEHPAFLITAIIILTLSAVLLVVHGLAHKKPEFIWPAPWCFDSDPGLSAPCRNTSRQQDI